MFESIKNPYAHKIRNGSTARTDEVRGRDIEILRAYERIVGNIRTLLSKQSSRALQTKYVEFEHPWQLTNETVTKEFISPFCSVQLYLKNGEYLIELTTSTTSFDNGTGVNSTALLRLAFKHTADENTKLFIENCLKISTNDNLATYFLKRQEQHEEIMQNAYREWTLKSKSLK